MTLRVAVLVSGEGSNLQAILDRVHGRGAVEVVAVAANRPDAHALERAARAGVPTAVFQAVDRSGRAERDSALARWLEEAGVELVVLAGFMEVLSGEFVRRFDRRIVNVHPSLLPAFPGIRAIEQAIDYGARVTGVTVHFVDEGVDSGPILLQEPLALVPYPPDLRAVESSVHEIEHRLLPRAIELIAAGAVRFDERNPRLVHVGGEAAGGDD